MREIAKLASTLVEWSRVVTLLFVHSVDEVGDMLTLWSETLWDGEQKRESTKLKTNRTLDKKNFVGGYVLLMMG